MVAPAPGIVIYAGQHAEYGVTLIIDHGNDIKTLYGHLTRVGVQAEEQVERGQVVAFTGNTGRSSGPHLHYEIQVKGRRSIPAPTSGIRRAPIRAHLLRWRHPSACSGALRGARAARVSGPAVLP